MITKQNRNGGSNYSAAAAKRCWAQQPVMDHLLSVILDNAVKARKESEGKKNDENGYLHY